MVDVVRFSIHPEIEEATSFEKTVRSHFLSELQKAKLAFTLGTLCSLSGICFGFEKRRQGFEKLFIAAFTVSPRFNKNIETAGFEPAKSFRTAIGYVVPQAFVTRFLKAYGSDKDFAETLPLYQLSYILPEQNGRI